MDTEGFSEVDAKTFTKEALQDKREELTRRLRAAEDRFYSARSEMQIAKNEVLYTRTRLSAIEDALRFFDNHCEDTPIC